MSLPPAFGAFNQAAALDEQDLDALRTLVHALPVFHQFELRHVETASSAPGEIEAVVSTFNEDVPRGYFYRWYDRLLPGCFATALERGYPAVVYAHMLDEVPIGATMAAEETDEGLLVRGRLFIDEVQAAKEAWTAMRETGGDGRPPLREFSISGRVVRSRELVEDEREIREIEEFDLWEWGPCVRGANVTRLIGVGGAQVKNRSPAPPAGAPAPELEASGRPEPAAVPLALLPQFPRIR